jgi:hypothetical protein
VSVARKAARYHLRASPTSSLQVRFFDRATVRR